MNTEGLIKALAEDHRIVGPRLGRQIALAVLIGTALCAVVFWLTLGPRPDLAAALGSWRFVFKFVVTTLLAVSAAWACLRLTHPEDRVGSVAVAAVLAPVVLAAGVVTELFSIDPAGVAMSAIGKNAVICLTAIPLLSLPPLVVILLALRHGAPGSPAAAGAMTGLLAGAIAATFYAAQCTDDSPLFVATWYVPAIGMVVLLGALAGSRLLRW